MHKQSTKGRKYTKEILSTAFFLIKDKLICFIFKYSLLGQQGWKFFFLLFQKMGWSGDGKQNILFGRPNPSHVLFVSLLLVHRYF